MNSESYELNLSNLKNDRYDSTLTMFFTFICGFLLGILIKYLKEIKRSALKVKETCLNIDSIYNLECKMVFCVRTDIKMNKGKICSQCCHACLSVYEKMLKRKNQLKNSGNSQSALTYFDVWKKTGQKKIVLKISSAEEMYEIERKAKMKNLITSIIIDAGRTQIEPNTETVIAIEPVPDEVVNDITGQLKLL
ncbi:peptidyl-tRNA hydrolase 2 [Plasmodium brasilianum]|uniref:peptidyl-tRNA hydrolase n=2 Tax=Plasmodium (Plasmodium) TaxID=418103 RepID=A0A1D3JIB3_PLAMA|nr:peptidyl-tRNA hydrolase 2, putative [Plasmodium malariae]KAI4840656.1 peptidyl-tRNA hydrolase 2 [Plasmodium brasilianum]SBT86220.1 peptidyl-tRNA hydrolase 2, putative [Plasmodium malariae]